MCGGWATTNWDSKPLYSKVPLGTNPTSQPSYHQLATASFSNHVASPLISPTIHPPTHKAFLGVLSIRNRPSEESAGDRGEHWPL